ncbi:MAG: glycosyltransferase [Rhodobacteraceae bacterium]|nr:glycosyltransferase [Paracoccaceae bacterium]
MTPQLYIMLKEPRPGRVKTRLGRDIGMVPAAWWFRHQTRALIRHVGYDPRWQAVLAVSPDMDGLDSRIWPTEIPRWPQGRGNLGDRMGRVLRHAPPGPVVIIGADIPGITPELIAQAFRVLGRHDAVFGPAPDGGYWLVGLKRVRGVPAKLFDGVRWSTNRSLADTLKTLPDHSVGKLPVLRDVDTVADFA